MVAKDGHLHKYIHLLFRDLPAETMRGRGGWGGPPQIAGGLICDTQHLVSASSQAQLAIA